jgi:hypothetical protein
MFNFLFTLAVAGAGYFLGSLGAKRAIDERIDSRLAELGQAPVPQAGPPAPPLAAAPKPAPAPKPKAAAKVAEEELSPETLTVITAAICAFLGKPARIRRVRRLGAANAWAQVGRVNVMASHTLTRGH